MSVDTAPGQAPARLSTLDRWLPAWIGLAMVAGLLPLLTASGAGAASRFSIGIRSSGAAFSATGSAVTGWRSSRLMSTVLLMRSDSLSIVSNGVWMAAR